MLQMRWVKLKIGKEEDVPKALIKGWYDHNEYYVLQFREIVKVDEDGEVITATEWQTVKEEKQ